MGSKRKSIQPPDVKLTAREREVLQALSHGGGIAGAAKEIGISFETARTHAKNAMRKLGVRTSSHAIAEAMRRGLIA